MVTSHQRLERMRKSFEKKKSISYDDYTYFTTSEASTPRASTLLNKAARKSAEQNEQQFPEQNEKQSSDKSDD